MFPTYYSFVLSLELLYASLANSLVQKWDRIEKSRFWTIGDMWCVDETKGAVKEAPPGASSYERLANDTGNTGTYL